MTSEVIGFLLSPRYAAPLLPLAIGANDNMRIDHAKVGTRAAAGPTGRRSAVRWPVHV